MWCILVLEDDPDLRSALVMALEDEDYEVHGASRGAEALATAAQRQLHVTIADVRMEGPDGLETLAALKQRQPAMHCLVMTGYADDDAPRRALTIQVDDYLYKPFRTEDLVGAVRRLQSRQQDQSTYEDLFASVLGGYERFIRPSPAGVDHPLEAVRHAAFRSFYVGIRATKLNVQEALQIWDLLEQAENHRAAGATGELLNRLGQAYQAIPRLVAALERSRLAERRPQPGQLTAEAFQPLYRKIAGAALSLEQVKMAPALRSADRIRLATDPAMRRLLEAVWLS